MTSTSAVGGPQPTAAREGRHKQRYAESGARLVAGCIPVRFASGDPSNLEVLLVSSRGKAPDGSLKANDGKGFCFPKGGWESDECVQTAAVRETVEEAGVRGRLVQPMLGAFPFTSCKPSAPHTRNQGRCVAHMFLLRVEEELSEWPEGRERRRHWLPLPHAARACRYDWMVHALTELERDLPEWVARLQGKAPCCAAAAPAAAPAPASSDLSTVEQVSFGRNLALASDSPSENTPA